MQEIFRVRGTLEVLRTLLKFSEPILEKTFLKEFNRISYYNAYTRSKDILREAGLTHYDLDLRGEKTIVLTKKGRDIAELLKKAEEKL